MPALVLLGKPRGVVEPGGELFQRPPHNSSTESNVCGLQIRDVGRFVLLGNSFTTFPPRHRGRTRTEPVGDIALTVAVQFAAGEKPYR